MGDEKLARVRDLARRRRAVILAHHYQVEEVKEAADYVGDSYGLAVSASRCEAEVVVMCGVRFMAESVAILSPDKKVLLPVPEAGCPLADTIDEQDVRALRSDHPGLPVVAYVNTTAMVKAAADYCCTSANAAAVVRSIDAPGVIFVPDANLANWTAAATGRCVIPWRGTCHVHQRVRAEHILALKREHPGAEFIAHPECRPEVVALADAVTSTTGFFKYAASSRAATIIVGTEEGVLARLRRENPGKRFLPAASGMVCPNMKLTTLDDVLEALEEMKGLVELEEDVSARARRALERMVAVAG